MMKLEDELQECSGPTQSSVMDPRPWGQVGQRLHRHDCRSTEGPHRSKFTIITVHVDLHLCLYKSWMAQKITKFYVLRFMWWHSVPCPQSEQRQSMATELISGQG